MQIRLSTQPPKVYFNRPFDFALSTFDFGLHSILRLNSTGHHYDAHWEHCFPTAFGFGLVADYIEEHLERLSWLTDYHSPEIVSERLERVLLHSRNKFKELSGNPQH